MAIAIEYGDKTDYIIQDIDGGRLCKFKDAILSKAGVARITVDNKGIPISASLMAGSLIGKDGFKLEIESVSGLFPLP